MQNDRIIDRKIVCDLNKENIRDSLADLANHLAHEFALPSLGWQSNEGVDRTFVPFGELPGECRQ